MGSEVKAGRVMDAQVAEKVMGWASVHIERHGDVYLAYGKPPDKDFDCTPVPQFTTDPSAAWQVVEKMSSTTKEFWTIRYFSSGCEATFSYEGGRDLPWKPGEYVGEGSTMPEAVCRAALAALEDKP